MKRLFPVILVLLVVALSGCTGQDASSETEGHTFDRANLNLNGKMMDLEFLPTDVRAGEKITANLVVGNTGSENIARENIEIKVKAISLNDFLANIALLAMSESKKTVTFSNEYNEEIKPGMIKPISYAFPTPKELKGKNLDGIYSITIILSVNGQNVESRTTKIKLRSGKPREISNTLEPASTSVAATTATSTPTGAATAAPTVSLAETPAPTPTPAPQETVDTFLFGWDDVPGTDSARLTGYLKTKFGVDWVENANIEKDENDKIINITSENHYISLTLDDYRAKLTLGIDDGRTAEYIGIIVNGKVKIYTGIIKLTRIQSWKFTESDIKLDAGSWIQWRNMDEEPQFTISEANGKLANITVRSRTDYYFGTTGTYTLELYYPKMRVSPPTQIITVVLNQSQ